MGKKRKFVQISTESPLESELTAEQCDKLMLAGIRKLNNDGARIVKHRLCQTVNDLVKSANTNSSNGSAAESQSSEFADIKLSTPITETFLMKNLNRAVESGLLTRQRTGSIISYGIAGEKKRRIDLTHPDPLEDGTILESIVRSLLVFRRNEGKPRGFSLKEIVNIFLEANEVKCPDDKDDEVTVVQNVVLGALKRGTISGHVRKLEQEYFVTGKSPTEGAAVSTDPFSTHA